MRRDIVISDLSRCRPATQLDRDYRHGTWRLVDYETSEFAGTMVYSGQGMASGELTLPMDFSGHHAIYMGLHYPTQFGDAHVRVRLTGDPAYTLVRAELPNPKDIRGLPAEFGDYYLRKRFADYQLSEAFWRVADLTGQNLIISRFNDGGGRIS